MRARHYDPNSGRFIQEDPIGTSDDVNLYRYVKNNPLKYTDRFGLAAKAFVVAYDEYRDYKETVDDLNLMLLDSQPRINIIYKLAELENRAKTLHYARNTYNTNLPTGIQNAEENGWKQPTLAGSTYAAAYFHQDPSTTGIDLKFVSSDGHREIIFSQNSQIITNPIYYGTYNFYSPGDVALHTKYDVEPYREWGNTSPN